MLCATHAYERDFVLPVLHNRNAAYVKLNSDIIWQKIIYENISAENQQKEQNVDLSILKNMIGFIQQNYMFKITLANIAASGSVGQSKCCKLFAKYIGQTPNLYLTKYRLDKSTSLLKSTNMTVTEIANAVGFNGSSYYAEVFRSWYGKSPSEYRTSD